MKNIIKDISIYSFGEILTKGIGFISIIFYTHFISQQEIGIYGYLLVIVSFFNIFLALGADNAYARYFFEYKDNFEKKQTLTTTILFLFTLWSFFVVLVLLFFTNDISVLIFDDVKYNTVFLFAFLSLPLRLISTLLNQALRNQFKTKIFVLNNFLNALITLLSSIFLLVFTDLGLASIFVGMVIADLLTLPIRVYFIKELIVWNINISVLKKILIYGLPFVPSSIAYWVFSSADRIMLEKMSNLESLGIYTVAVSLSIVMNLVSSAIGQGWGNHALKLYEDNNETARITYINFLHLLIFATTIIIFLAAILGKELIILFFPSEYSNVFYPMFFLLVGIGFQMTTQVTALGINLLKRTYYIIYITLFIALFNILMNYILIPIFEETGAAFATMLSYLFLTIIYAFVSQKLYKLNYNLILISIPLFLVIMAFLGSLLEFYIRILILSVVLLLIYYNKYKIIQFIKVSK